MECWSNGILEVARNSTTPSLQYSNPDKRLTAPFGDPQGDRPTSLFQQPARLENQPHLSQGPLKPGLHFDPLRCVTFETSHPFGDVVWC